MLRGRYEASGAKLEAAARMANGTMARAQIRGKLGELAFRRGDMEQAIESFEKALRELGAICPRNWLMQILLGLWEGLIQGLHIALPSCFLHRKNRLPNERERLTLKLLSNLAHANWYCRGKFYLWWSHLRGMNLAERYQPSAELAQSYAEHAPGMTLFGFLKRAERYASKSLEIRREFGDLWGQGQSLHYQGVVLYAGSRYRQCIEKCREAIRLLERTGDYWQVHIARYQIAASLYRLGDADAALREAQLNYRSGIELGDVQASAIILDIWARTTRGTVPEEILEQEVHRPRRDVQGAAQVLFAQGLCLARKGDFSGAVEILQQAIAEVDQAGICNAYTLPCRPWLATVLRLQAAQLQDHTPGRRARLLRRAESVARQAIRESRFCRNELPHALREMGALHAMHGASRTARQLLHRSRRLAQSQEARWEHAQTLVMISELGRELGWPDADASRAAAQKLLGELHAFTGNTTDLAPSAAPPTLSLSDRFDSVLDWGRRIASALSRELIYGEARSAALRLLRAEHCLVLQRDGDQDTMTLLPVTGSLPGQWNEERIREVIRTQRTVAFDEESPSDGSDAGSSAQQSVLCVPLCVRGVATACLYVTHQQVRGLFGPVEQRLADFIATVAGAALENAEGFTQLQTLNETLERRVAERTAAAEFRAQELANSNRQLERLTQELLSAQKELMVAKQDAETANLAKSRFLAAVSHEIRTPMNGILGMTELALNTEISKRQRNYLTMVKDSANSLLALINDILDFSKIEAQRLELEAIPFSVVDTVEGAVRLLAVSAAQKGLELICVFEPGVPARLLGDPGRLRQIVINLVGNAIKFTDRGEVAIRVDCSRPSDGATILHLVVEDTGIGIPDDRKQAIFEAFRQSDTSMTRRYGGTGLGLAICAELARLMGGRIWVDSEVGEGSSFHLHVQMEWLDEEPTVPPSPFDREQREVLLVSTNSKARDAYREVLEQRGFLVTVGDKLPSEDVALQHPAAVLVVDLPSCSDPAQDPLPALMQFEQLKQRPVVVLVPAGRVEIAEQCEDLGIDFCLAKPPKTEELVAAVRATKKSPEVLPSFADPTAVDRPLRLLVADDSPVNQAVAAGLLELVGHKVVVVGTGQEAIDAWHGALFDAIFMDIEMPEMDGLTATARIRELETPRGRHTPIIALTAHALSGSRERCLAAGMDGYVSKPLEPEEFFAVLESVAPRANAIST